MSKRVRYIGVALAASLALPASALAQATSDLVESAEITNDADFEDANISGRVWTANIETCRDLLGDDDELDVTWTLASAYTDSDERYALKLEGPTDTCDTTSVGQENDEVCDFITTNQSIGTGTTFDLSIRPSRIFGFSSADDCFVEQDSAFDMILVLPRLLAGSDEDDYEPDVVRIRLDTARPAAPTGSPNVSAGESRLDVSWNEVSDAAKYKIYASTTEIVAGALPETVTGASTSTVTTESGSITGGISVGQNYFVGVVAIDAAGNESVLSTITEVVTQPTSDFWELYRDAGGQEGGGCSSTGSLPPGLPLLFAFGLFFTSHRRRGDSA